MGETSAFAKSLLYFTPVNDITYFALKCYQKSIIMYFAIISVAFKVEMWFKLVILSWFLTNAEYASCNCVFVSKYFLCSIFACRVHAFGMWTAKWCIVPLHYGITSVSLRITNERDWDWLKKSFFVSDNLEYRCTKQLTNENMLNKRSNLIIRSLHH